MAARTASGKNVDELLKALLVLGRTVDHVLETRAVAAGAKRHLSSSKIQILRLLGNRGAKTSTQVARFLGVSKPAVPQIVDSMTKARLVTRRTAKHDRREVHLQLSAKGHNLFLAVRNAQRHYIRNAMRNPKKRDMDRWITAMHELSSSLGQADQAFLDFCAHCGAHEDGTCVLVGGDAKCVFEKTLAENKKKAKSSSKG